MTVGEKYFFNCNTSKLHIDGFCNQSKYKPFDVKYFNSEADAAAYAGGHLLMCKNCQKKRDKLLEQIGKET